MKIVNELLAPVGSYEAVKVAISAGADAIYLAGKRFGARAFIANLSDEEIVLASKYVHLYGKKIYITLNTLIFEDELEEVKSYIDFLYQYVDALIVQDYGIIHYVRSKYPDFPIHLSTQTSIHNKNDVLFLKSLGVDRIVLAREVSIKEIREIKKLDVDLEVFIHGALCFSYSGLCYLSYYKGGRSGNRGSCAQPCRQDYTLIEDGEELTSGPLLSMKDLNTINNIKELLEVGVTSLKIEGRAKSLDYLYTSIRIYRQLIDEFNHKEVLKVDSKALLDLYTSFSRERTKGYLFLESNHDVTTDKIVKHQGVLIGKVLEYKNKEIKVKLNEELNLLDGLRIVSKGKEYGLTVTRIIENGKLVKSSNKRIVFLDVKNYIEPGSFVFKTSSGLIEKEIKSLENPYYQEAELSIVLEENRQNITIKVNDIEVSSTFNKTLEKAKSIDDTKIVDQFKKTNNLPIKYININFKNEDHLYISIPDINEIRRDILEKLKDRLENNVYRKHYDYPLKLDDKLFLKEKMIDELVLKEENIIRHDEISSPAILAFHLKEIGSSSHISPYLGVNNHYAVNFFRNLTKGVIILGYESSLENALEIAKLDKNIGFLSSFREPLMVANHCVVAKNKGFKDKKCGMCYKHKYQLKDNDHLYDLMFRDCTMYIKGKEINRSTPSELVKIIIK